MKAENATTGEPEPKPLFQLLQAPLDSAQSMLLELTFLAVTELTGNWPIWDYVSRELVRHPGQEDVNPLSVLRSLPDLRVPERDSHSGPYGLFWVQDGFSGSEPPPDKRIGLTIAGLVAISERHSLAKVVADGASSMIGALARLERELPSNPEVPATTQNISMERARPFYKFGNELGQREIKEEIFFSVLEKEYVTVPVQRGPGTDPVTELGSWLRPYRHIENAAGYMEIIEREQSAQRPDPRLRADDLPLMLDYVSYVLASRSDWGVGLMVQPPDLRAVGSLFAAVSSEAEFHVCMSDLATLMQRLNVPKLSDRGKGDNPGSLVRLQHWLTKHIEDETDRAQALEAVEDVRSILAIRTGLQHPSAQTTSNTSNALTKLNIPNPIRNWGEAWDIIRARTADAFDIVRQRAQP